MLHLSKKREAGCVYKRSSLSIGECVCVCVQTELQFNQMDCLAIVSLIQEFVVALSVQNFLCALTGNFICSESMNTMHTHSITYTWMRHIKMNNGGGLTFVKARVAICRKLIMLRMHSFHPTESRFVSYIVPLLLALINLIKEVHPPLLLHSSHMSPFCHEPF